jgi:hypothetical protein
VAEERRDIFDPKGKGIVRKWVVVNKNNHYLDATALACVAAGCLGVRVVPRVTLENVPAPKPIPKRPVLTAPNGQPFFVSERK